MQTALEKKAWYDKFIQVFDDIPESDGFEPDIADKQIEGLLELIVLLGEKVTHQENEMQLLAGKLLKRMSSDDEDDEYVPQSIPSSVESLFI